MDEFREAADKDDVSQAVLIGAIYGIFLVFGQAWSDLLKSIAAEITPEHDNELLQNLIHVVFTTLLCVSSLVGVMKCYKLMRYTKKRLLSRKTKQISIVTKAKTKAEVKQGKK
jgi:hypothetical protein